MNAKETWYNRLFETNWFDKEELNEIMVSFYPLSVRKGTVLLCPENSCNRLYLIHKGALRTYFIHEKGVEKTRFIGFAGNVITALSGFITGQPASEYVEALEQSEVLVIDRNDFFRLVSTKQGMKSFYLDLLEKAYLHQNLKIEERLTSSAGQRLENLQKEAPWYLWRISNKILASYLDVSPETLSRIKSGTIS